MRPMWRVSAISAVSSSRHGVVGRLHGGEGAVRAAFAVLAAQQVDPPEEEVLELAVQPVEMDPGAEDLGVPFRECAGGAYLAPFTASCMRNSASSIFSSRRR